MLLSKHERSRLIHRENKATAPRKGRSTSNRGGTGVGGVVPGMVFTPAEARPFYKWDRAQYTMLHMAQMLGVRQESINNWYYRDERRRNMPRLYAARMVWWNRQKHAAAGYVGERKAAEIFGLYESAVRSFYRRNPKRKYYSPKRAAMVLAARKRKRDGRAGKSDLDEMRVKPRTSSVGGCQLNVEMSGV